MNYVADLRFEDEIGLDRSSLETLFMQLGPTGAEDVVCRAMEELASRLAELRDYHDRNAFQELARRARSLIAIADQVGLISLAEVAADVMTCANRLDIPALAATLSRLERVGDRSLTAVWDQRDLTV